ncbi:MAG: glycosyltransferase [Burkholderiales bacterium]
MAPDPAAALTAIAASPRPRVALVSHGWGGGVRRHVDELALALADRAEVLRVEPAASGGVRVRWARDASALDARFAFPAERTTLVALLAGLGVSRIHLHHVDGLPRAILDLPGELGVPFDVTLHDAYPICPRYHLDRGEGRYCGEPDETGCDACLARRPAQWPLDIRGWRDAFGGFLAAADRVIAPTRDVADRTRRRFPALAISVRGHPDAAAPSPGRTIRVGLLGRLTAAKGLDVVVACARDAQARGLPLAFRVIGPIGAPLPPLPAGAISFTGEYDEADLARLIAAESPDVWMFPAQVPESWSYTLGVALATGRPIVASSLGAFGERLAGVDRARIVAWDAPAAEWNDALVALAAIEPAPRSANGTGSPLAAQWRDYADWLSSRWHARLEGPAAPLPPLDARHLAPAAPGAALPLVDLVRAGALCGDREALAELVARAKAADDALTDVARARATGEPELKAARERIAELEGSTSWRITAPVRTIVGGVRRAGAGVASAPAAMRHLPRRTSTALAILRDQGVAALARRIGEKLKGRGRAPPVRRRSWSAKAAIAPLAFRAAADPRWTIVVPAYGEPLLTYTCLASLHETVRHEAVEVIVVDDASPEPLAESLAAVSGVRFERAAVNGGFVAACNRGARLARGARLVFLNNDTIVTPGWLDAIERTFERHPDAGIVGAKLVYPDGTLQEAGGIVWRDGSAWNVGRGADPDRPEFNYARRVDYVSGACLAVDRALFAAIGGFDARYSPAYYEDTDLAFAVRAAGRSVWYQPEATVVHFEGRTSGTDLAAGVKRHQVVNRETFARKWAIELARHRPNGEAPALAADRDVGFRVLVVDACMLTPDRDSGSLRMQAIVELIGELGGKATFVADNLEYREPYVGALRESGVEVLTAPYVRSVGAILAQRGPEFDAVVLSRHYVASKHVEAVRRHAPRAKLVFDTVDLHFLRAERQAELEGGSAHAAAARSQREAELDLVRRVDATWVVSPVERQLLAGLVPGARVEVLSNIHEPMAAGRAYAARAGLVFIGGFRHPPNADGILWYAHKVLPLLRERLPGVVTTIVGAEPPPKVAALAGPDVVVTGHVEDLGPIYTAARVSIAPLRYGAGVKGKVNLAMSYGVPVVATTPAVEGMGLAPGHDVLVADDPVEYAQTIVRAYTDEALWQRLREGGLANLREHFSRDTAKRALAATLGVDSRGRRGPSA